MKAKRTAPPRRRVSFAVDRDEIEINSDWVDAVMSPVAAPPLPEVSPAMLVPFPAPQSAVANSALEAMEAPGAPYAAGVPIKATIHPGPQAEPIQPPAAGSLFFAPEENNATGAKSATDERCIPVENSAAVDKLAPVAQITAVENQSSVEESATIAESATVEDKSTVEHRDRGAVLQPPVFISVENNATAADIATGAPISTGEEFVSAKDHRIPRPRAILRITDGLTPGQYAVYSLMYEAGEGTGASSRIYKGGYADLGRLTGLSKRGIQNIVAELQAKQVIRIHQQPGYHRTETTAYLVPDPDSVLHTWFANGWRHALGKSKTLVRLNQ